MYELIQVTDRSYYIQSPAKIGLVKLGGAEVCLIDSGNDKDAGRKVRQLLDADRHLQHPLQRRPHRGEQVPAGADGVQDLRARGGVRLHPVPGAGAVLPVRRLPLPGPAAQISHGPGERGGGADPGGPPGGLRAPPSAGAFL